MPLGARRCARCVGNSHRQTLGMLPYMWLGEDVSTEEYFTQLDMPWRKCDSDGRRQAGVGGVVQEEPEEMTQAETLIKELAS